MVGKSIYFTRKEMEGQMMKDYTLTGWEESGRRKERL